MNRSIRELRGSRKKDCLKTPLVYWDIGLPRPKFTIKPVSFSFCFSSSEENATDDISYTIQKEATADV